MNGPFKARVRLRRDQRLQRDPGVTKSWRHRRLRGALGLRDRICALVLIAAASALGSCDEKQDDSLILRIPSPAGSGVVIKNYSRRSGSYIMHLITKPPGGDERVTTILTEAPRGNRVGQEDGVVVGWTGESRVTIGWPTGDAVPPGLPARADGSMHSNDVGIAYINYEPDLAKVTPHRFDKVTLQDVKYTAEPRLDGPFGSCVVKVDGKDGNFFGHISINVATSLYLLSAAGEKQFSDNFDSLEFSLVPLPDRRSPQLTPTHAKMGSIGPYATFTRPPQLSVLQTNTTLSHVAFSNRDHVEIFRMLRDGNYSIKFNLTFDLHQIEYLIHEPIGADVILAYQACLAKR